MMLYFFQGPDGPHGFSVRVISPPVVWHALDRAS